MQNHRRFWTRFGALVGLLSATISMPAAWAQGGSTSPAPSQWPVRAWQPVMTGITYGISGMALIEQKEATATTAARRVFLVVHDNKNAAEGRLSLLTLQGVEAPRYTPLDWPVARGSALPIDLEALTAVPGQPEAFLALSSDGIVTRLQLNEAHTAVQVATSFKLPNYKAGANFEGFSLAQIGPSFIAVWGQRGSNAQPGTLYFATLDPETNAFGPMSSATLVAPWPAVPSATELTANPKLNVRAISDLKVDPSGALFVSSASDGSDDGPFSSAFYLAGSITLVNGAPQFMASPNPWLLGRFPGHKIEAFDFVPGPFGGPVFGTDDENRGAFLWVG